jgi:hypothetical protein
MILKQVLKNVPINQTLIIHQTEATQPYIYPIEKPATLFTEDVAIDLNTVKIISMTLPSRDCCRLIYQDRGRAMAKADINKDGMEDFILEEQRVNKGRFFISNKSGGFMKKAQPAFAKDSAVKMWLLFFLMQIRMAIWICTWEAVDTSLQKDAPELQDRLYLNDGTGNFTKKKMHLPAMLISTVVFAPMISMEEVTRIFCRW